MKNGLNVETQLVREMRQGFRIEMGGYPGLSDPALTTRILFVSLLHDQQNALF